MPNAFIDLAEETGDIVPMGRWILREACRQTREWQVRLALPDLHVTVNLSARQFQEHDLVDSIGAVLAETGLPPGSLTLEITESGLMQRTAGTIGRLGALRDLGVHLAIDDFGTGYSSLSYLERFPVDILKIDRSFISAVSTTGERSAIARAIVDLGRTLGLQVVAEGIEEADQAAWLVSLGCPFGQGYLYSRPMGVDATEAFLAADATRRVQVGAQAAASPSRKARRTVQRRLRLVSGE
jgi:EAL domain-containing protein (putative c-di-GMP-specific phosphodiesterase class I)